MFHTVLQHSLGGVQMSAYCPQHSMLYSNYCIITISYVCAYIHVQMYIFVCVRAHTEAWILYVQMLCILLIAIFFCYIQGCSLPPPPDAIHHWLSTPSQNTIKTGEPLTIKPIFIGHSKYTYPEISLFLSGKWVMACRYIFLVLFFWDILVLIPLKLKMYHLLHFFSYYISFRDDMSLDVGTPESVFIFKLLLKMHLYSLALYPLANFLPFPFYYVSIPLLFFFVREIISRQTKLADFHLLHGICFESTLEIILLCIIINLKHEVHTLVSAHRIAASVPTEQFILKRFSSNINAVIISYLTLAHTAEV